MSSKVDRSDDANERSESKEHRQLYVMVKGASEIDDGEHDLTDVEAGKS